jgi:tetratricopeptide (TPR) repeat protein
MFFPRLRRQAKWVFVFLALVFGLGFVVFGVGSGGGLGLGDILKGSGGSSSSSPSISNAQARIDKNAQDAPAYKLLAQAYQNEGRVDLAIPPLEHYTKLRPRDTDALQQLGSLYLDRLQRAQDEYSLAQYNSQNATFGQLVNPPLQLGNGQTLPADPITQAEIAKSDQAVNTATQNLQSVSKKATGVYQTLAKLSPRDPSIQLQLGQVAESGGDVATAIKAYRRFVQLSPGDPNRAIVQQHLKELTRVSTQPSSG